MSGTVTTDKTATLLKYYQIPATSIEVTNDLNDWYFIKYRDNPFAIPGIKNGRVLQNCFYR